MKVAGIDAIPRKGLRGQRVLVRIDAETDEKLRDSLPTLAFFLQSGARVVVATHRSSPASLDGVAVRLGELLGRAVNKLDEWKGEAGLIAVSHLGEGEVVMIENLAFEPGEEAAEDSLADELARLCDIYCNDAFRLSHEVRASTVGVAKRVAPAVAGLAFERELNWLSLALDAPHRPLFTILGGELSKNKLLFAEEISRRSESMFVAGQLSFPFLIAQGFVPGNAVVSDEMVKIAERMMTEAHANKRDINTPVDFTVADKVTFEKLSRGERFIFPPPLQNVKKDELTPDQVICDIGTVTRWTWGDSFGPARTIFWHGPLGISEIDLFGEGTRFLAAGFANRTWPTLHRSVVSGESLVELLRQMDIATERIKHVTDAGRAALCYLAGRPLPAVDVLNKASKPRRETVRVLVPLNGTESDASAVYDAAEMATHETEIFLLHTRSGPDQEQYPDLMIALSEAERLERRIESKRIFAQANAILASFGFISANQVAVQGEPAKIVLRHANRTRAELIVMAANGLRPVIDHATCAVLVARPGSAIKQTSQESRSVVKNGRSALWIR
jgi:phosphoglycerate kinase